MYRDPRITTLEEDFQRLQYGGNRETFNPFPMPQAPQQPPAQQTYQESAAPVPQRRAPPQRPAAPPAPVAPAATAPQADQQESTKKIHSLHGPKRIQIHKDAATKAANRKRRHSASYRAQLRKAGTGSAKHRRQIRSLKLKRKYGEGAPQTPVPAVQESRRNAPAPVAPARPGVPQATQHVQNANRLRQESQRLQQEATAVDGQRPMRVFARVALISENLHQRFQRLARVTNDLALSEQSEDLGAVSRVAQEYAKQLSKGATFTEQMETDFNSMIGAVSEALEVHDELEEQFAADAGAPLQ